MGKKAAGRPQPASVSDQIDRELAARALEKRKQGKTPTAQERAALRKLERARDLELREHHYRTLPKKLYCQWSGRQHKVVNEQAARYGLPLAGRTIDLPAVVRALHDFLAENAQRLADDDPMAGPTSPAMERWREEKYRLARIERRQRERTLLPRGDIHSGLARVASVIRRAGDALQRQFGDDAAKILTNALDDAQHEIDRLFGDTDDDHPDP